MSFALSVQFGLDDDALPARPQVRRWAKRAYVLACEALAVKNLQLELIIRYVNEKEGRALNRQFRQKDYATNVLTFVHTGDPPSEPKARSKRSDAPRKVIADIAICAPVVAKEAKAQKKSTHAHHAHMVVHATLHALGFDHENEPDATHMETLETHVLHRFRIKNPYA